MIKKITYFSLLLCLCFGLVSCISSSTTLEIVEVPSITYTENYNGEFKFTVKLDGNSYELVYKNGEPTTNTTALLTENGLTVSDITFDVGNHNVVVRYGQIKAYFEYMVTSDEASGNGTVTKPYVIKTAHQLINLKDELALENREKGTLYIKIEADLDFSNNDDLLGSVNNVLLDGSKTLGGNYKILNLKSKLFGDCVDSTFKNLDLVDCQIKTDESGVECFLFAQTFTRCLIKNVNIYGDSFIKSVKSGAGYAKTAIGTKFEDCTTYTDIITSGAANGFITYVGGTLDETTPNNNDVYFINCKNYGNIQGMDVNCRVSGICGGMTAKYYQKCKINVINCANYGTIKYYGNEATVKKVNGAIESIPGAFTIFGNQWSTTAETTEPGVGMGWIVYNSNNNSYENVRVDQFNIDSQTIVNSFQSLASGVSVNIKRINDEQQTIQISNLDKMSVDNKKVVKVTVTVVHSSAVGYNVESNIKNYNDGNVIIYNEITIPSGNSDEVLEFIIPSLDDLKNNYNNPFSTSLTKSITLGNTQINTDKTAEGYGYEVLTGGMYRVASKGTDKVVNYCKQLSVIGYNSAGEIVFIVVYG